MPKSQMVSMRLTEAEMQTIKEKASNAGLSLSRYMVNAALADRGLTAADKQKIYFHKAVIQDCAKQLIGKYDDPTAKELHRKTEELWQLLK